MKIVSKITLAATFGLALAFSFSCSSGDDNDDNGGGGGQGVPFNENSQIYDWDGSDYTGNGIIESVSGGVSCGGNCVDGDCNRVCKWNGFKVGIVTNGIVKLELPDNIPDEHSVDFLEESLFSGCPDTYKDIKTNSGGFGLFKSDKEYVGGLVIRYADEQIYEQIAYMYFSKAGKITCNFKEDVEEEGGLFNIDVDINAKKGWNKVYAKAKPNANGGADWKLTTNNILTKEMKWTID